MSNFTINFCFFPPLISTYKAEIIIYNKELDITWNYPLKVTLNFI